MKIQPWVSFDFRFLKNYSVTRQAVPVMYYLIFSAHIVRVMVQVVFAGESTSPYMRQYVIYKKMTSDK